MSTELAQIQLLCTIKYGCDLISRPWFVRNMNGQQIQIGWEFLNDQYRIVNYNNQIEELLAWQELLTFGT